MAKKKHEEEEHENSERWLLTYADLITLLLALFIILYSMSQVDQQKYEAVAEVFREKMGDQTGFGVGAEGDAAEYTLPPGDILSEEIDVNGSGKGTALDKIYDAMQKYVADNHLEDQLAIQNENNYVRIQIKDKLMFIPDSSRLIDPDNPVLENLEKAVAQVYPEVDYITFGGHTADLGVDSLMNDQTSWRLSTERAITVLNRFIAYGLPQNKLAVEGYAHFDPIADNSTEEGKALNRRVDITIYKNPPIVQAPAKGSDSSPGAINEDTEKPTPAPTTKSTSEPKPESTPESKPESAQESKPESAPESKH